MISLVAMSRSGHRAVMSWLRRRMRTTVVEVESKPWEVAIRKTDPADLASKEPLFPVLLLRDYPNWAASVASYFPDPHHVPLGSLDAMVDAWITHAEQVGAVPTILFPEWVRAGHGRGIHIHGSTRFDNADVLDRTTQLSAVAQERFDEMMRRDDALEISREVFRCP